MKAKKVILILGVGLAILAGMLFFIQQSNLGKICSQNCPEKKIRKENAQPAIKIEPTESEQYLFKHFLASV